MKAEKTNAHSDYVRSVAFSPDGSKIVSGSSDNTIKVWDANSFEMIESRLGYIAFGRDGEGVEREGATVRMKEGGGAFYAPSPVQSVAVSWLHIVAGASSGELYHLEVVEAQGRVEPTTG
jgi:WD40 repeat protein